MSVIYRFNEDLDLGKLIKNRRGQKQKGSGAQLKNREI